MTLNKVKRSSWNSHKLVHYKFFQPNILELQLEGTFSGQALIHPLDANTIK